MINKDKKLESLPLKVQPPPYHTGLYPLITGTVDIKGKVQMDKEKREREPQLGSHIHMDCYEGVKGAINEWDCDSDSDEGDSDRRSNNSHLRRIQFENKNTEKDEDSEEEEGDQEGASPLVAELKKEIRKSQRKKKAPKSYPGQFPILIKGQQAQYVPWGSQDLEGLISRHPRWSSKWIRMFLT